MFSKINRNNFNKSLDNNFIKWYNGVRKRKGDNKMKTTELVEFKNENGVTIYYKKNNGHKLTPEQLTYNQITKGLNYIIKRTFIIGQIYKR